MAYGDNLFTGGTFSAHCSGGSMEGWVSTAHSWPDWVKYDFGVGASWAITKMDYKSDHTAREQRAAVLAGSNNDSTYTTLWSGDLAHNTALQEFEFVNTTAYRYIKMTFNSGWHTGEWYKSYDYIRVYIEVVSGGGVGIGSPWIFIQETLDKGKKYFKKKGLFLPDDRLLKPQAI